MNAALIHRGPDGAGVWVDDLNGIALGHRRLAVVDLSVQGSQPMTSHSGRYVIVLNGEIYNHSALRTAIDNTPMLVSSGKADTRAKCVWRGHSDTETLLTVCETHGVEEALRMSTGMFALAVWDRETCTLSLARDRLGEKPLYYGWCGGALIFGSELKALRAYPGFRAEIDHGALAAYLKYGYVPAPSSIYQGIRKLPQGTLLTLSASNRASEPREYWSFLSCTRDTERYRVDLSVDAAVARLDQLLGDVVEGQMMADVPLGAFLSGGVDSSLIVALMQARGAKQVHSFTIGFDDKRYDESDEAGAVANYLGTNHSLLRVTAEEARAVVSLLPSLYDEPFGDSSQIPTYLVSRMARESVTVALSGDGGDELFCGYNRYRWARRVLAAPTLLRRGATLGLQALTPGQWDCVYNIAEVLLPDAYRVRLPGDKAHKLAGVLSANSIGALYESLVATWSVADGRVLRDSGTTAMLTHWSMFGGSCTPEEIMMAIDTVTYLPDDILCKIDRAAMGVSLETRAPFLDHRVVEFAWKLPMKCKLNAHTGKWLLRKVLSRYLPGNLTSRPKMGFGVPVGDWLRGPLREWGEDLLSEARLEGDGFFHVAPIRQKWCEHQRGTRNWQQHLWIVLMFQAWYAEQSN